VQRISLNEHTLELDGLQQLAQGLNLTTVPGVNYVAAAYLIVVKHHWHRWRRWSGRSPRPTIGNRDSPGQ